MNAPAVQMISFLFSPFEVIERGVAKAKGQILSGTPSDRRIIPVR